MRQSLLCIAAGLLLVLGSAAVVGAHCEIPCGIYDDQLRANLIAEHITTIEKSMKSILELEKASPVNYNQIVRWVVNKEKHADEIQHIVTQYFMTQRIKPKSEHYDEQLSLLHQMLLSAMKCKQTTDLKETENLRSLLKMFEKSYFGHTHK